MYRCNFCGLESLSEKARFCSDCGPDAPAVNWLPADVDQTQNIKHYSDLLRENYFDTYSEEESEKQSKRWRERLKISYSTHVEIKSKLAQLKSAIAHLSEFRFEFNENVTDAYAGHDTFLDFRFTNLSDNDAFKVSLLWDDPETTDRIDLRTDTKTFIKPHSSIPIGGKTVFDRIGIKEISDLTITITDEFGLSANFRAEPFRFKVGNHDQRIDQHISTHNQISIEGHGVVDASRMGAEKNTKLTSDSSHPRWIDLKFTYVLNEAEQFLPQGKEVEKPQDKEISTINSPAAASSQFDLDDLLSVLNAAEYGNELAQKTLGDMYLDGEGVAQNDELAFKWYSRAADQGFSRAQEKLGDMYEAGRGVDQDYEKAVQFYRKGAENGDAGCQRSLALMYQEGAGVTQSYEDALIWFLKAAEKGDSDAQYGVGKYYNEGLGLAINLEKSVFWYRKAADQGNVYAQHALGTSYALGAGVAKNQELAVHWYQKGAAQGYANSQCYLGIHFQYGSGVDQDFQKAAQLYENAAEQGVAQAQSNLADLYADGKGVTQNDELALKWYQHAAEQGDVYAQNLLGSMYFYGEGGVIKNYELAFHWYNKAADQGNEESQCALGCMYLNGQGVAQSDVQAESLFRVSAESGFAASQHNLGWLYEFGRGIDQNAEFAAKWYQKAADQGYEISIAALKNLNAGENAGNMNAEVANYVPTYTVSGPPTNGEASWVYEGYSYIGSYKDGLFNGWGEITWTGEYLGHRYVGNFVNGFRHGEGTYTFPNGEIQVGLFVNDEFVSPPEVVKNNECNSIEEIILHYGNKKIAALGRRFFINNGPIFAKKTKNFYESFSKVHFSIDLAEEKPVLFYDGTILGSGKDGIVFSDNFIYAKGCIGRPVEHVDIAYSQIDSVRMSGLEIYIESAGHLELITLRLIHATPEDLFLIVEMLKKIQDFVKH